MQIIFNRTTRLHSPAGIIRSSSLHSPSHQRMLKVTMEEDTQLAIRRTDTWPLLCNRQVHDVTTPEDTMQTLAFAQTGTPYPITDAELSILQEESITHRYYPWRTSPQPITLAQAHAQLETFAHKPWTQHLLEVRADLLKAYNLGTKTYARACLSRSSTTLILSCSMGSSETASSYIGLQYTKSTSSLIRRLLHGYSDVVAVSRLP